MAVREQLVLAALQLIESAGEQGFSTRAACDLAGVKAPTLYHHFGTADGLLSAALDEAFRQFLARKQALIVGEDAVAALMDGWDDYVAFATERPRLYCAMIARLLQGGVIPAAEQARTHLIARLHAIEVEGRLRVTQEEAADLVWGSAHAAAMLIAASGHMPAPAVISALRDTALSSIASREEGKVK